MPNLDDPNHAISFDADTIAQALVNIYQKKYGNGKEIEPTLFEKTKEIFEGAINKGVKQSSFSIDTAFKHQLTHNMWVFSAFRTHKMQRDIAKYLLNEKGELKPFTKFVKDVAPYIKHTNRLWLETEYNTAVLRAHQAADWRKFVDERDVLPNLEWQPSTSTNPGEDHKPYWFTCLPIDHKFWKQHRPGDRWNCKCSLRNTDKEPTPVPADTIIKGSEPQRGLESNPGEKGEIFSNNHPYYPENCGKCPFNKGVGKLWAALVGTKRDCFKCRIADEACGKEIFIVDKNGKELSPEVLNNSPAKGFDFEQFGHIINKKMDELNVHSKITQKIVVRTNEVRLFAENSILRFDAQFLNKDGKRMVHLLSIRVIKDCQGKGLASKITINIYAQCKECGINKIKFTASGDGSYVWATKGFTAKNYYSIYGLTDERAIEIVENYYKKHDNDRNLHFPMIELIGKQWSETVLKKMRWEHETILI